MATLNVTYQFTNGQVASASQVNSNFVDVKTFVEALAAGTNLDTGAVTTAKIQDGAITQEKLAPGVGVSGDSDQIVLGSQVFG